MKWLDLEVKDSYTAKPSMQSINLDEITSLKPDANGTRIYMGSNYFLTKIPYQTLKDMVEKSGKSIQQSIDSHHFKPVP